MKRHYLAGAALGIISFGLLFLFIQTELFQSLEFKFLDFRFRWRPQHRINPDIVIAAIDDNSITAVGRWPWPRKLHAEFLKRISDHPPKAIGFDILFTEAEPGDGDTALAYYSRLLGDVLYASYLSDIDGKIVSPIIESPVGLINAPPDKDGIIRKIPLVFTYNGEVLPSFTLQVLCIYLDISFKDVRIDLGKHISVPGFGNIPIDDKGFMWINFVGDQHVFKEIAFQQILSMQEIQTVANTLLLVGITATGIGDQGHIPVATNVPLITVHANVLNTILNKDFLVKMPVRINMIIIAICVFAGTIVNLFFRSIKGALLSLLILVSYIAINLWLFQRNIMIDFLGPSIGIVVPFLLITVYRYGWEERQRRWIKKVFAHYLSKDVIDTILHDPKRLQLGGELKTATVLYLDLRNFSTFCEERRPEDVVGFLNHSFDWMTEIILRRGGMLDKYIGDAIMAIFGAPLDSPPEKQVHDAVLAALEIVEKWHRLPGNVRSGLDVGIGINTGSMLIGNMGSSYIFNYTAIGDEVNIAARIQELCSEYQVNIIVTDSVYNLAEDRSKFKSLGEVNVKGRREPVIIYKVEDLK